MVNLIWKPVFLCLSVIAYHASLTNRGASLGHISIQMKLILIRYTQIYVLLGAD